MQISSRVYHMDEEQIKKNIKSNEGLRLKAYLCSQGIPTVGYGHTGPDVTKQTVITQQKAQIFFEKDYQKAKDGVIRIFGKQKLQKMGKARQGVVIDMAFNLGPNNLKKFPKLIAAIDNQQYQKAGYQITNSLYGEQVFYRANRNEYIMRTGQNVSKEQAQPKLQNYLKQTKQTQSVRAQKQKKRRNEQKAKKNKNKKLKCQKILKKSIKTHGKKSNMKDINNSISKFSNLNNGFGGGPFNIQSWLDIFKPYVGKKCLVDFSLINNLKGLNLLQTDFAVILFMLGLGESYNSYNKSFFNFPGLQNGEIGGVATQSGCMKNLLNSEYQLQDDWWICINSRQGEETAKFTSADLKTILRELSFGAFHEQSFPFFSLHFNDNGSLFSVIHPAYENTLIGQVISFLDYYMKGFLNGGIYTKQFLKRWQHEHKSLNRQDLKSYLIDLGKQFKKEGHHYRSLRQLMAEVGLQGEDKELSDQTCKTKFMTSFRIISQVKSVTKYSNMLQVNCDFDVFYTMELMPGYKKYLEEYQQKNGKLPQDHMRIQNIYKKMTTQIYQLMPKLSVFKRYFDLLKLISFVSSYFTTLKKMFKIPRFENSPISNENRINYNVPKLFPPIPVRYYSFHKLLIKFGDLVQAVNQRFPSLLDKKLEVYIQTGQFQMGKDIEEFIVHLLAQSIKEQVHKPGESFQINDDYIFSLSVQFSHYLKLLTSKIEERLTNFAKQLNKITRQLSANAQTIDIDKLTATISIGNKISYVKKFVEAFFILKENKQLEKLQQQKREAITKQAQQWEEFVKLDNKRKQQMKNQINKNKQKAIQQITSNSKDAINSNEKTLWDQAQKLIERQISKISKPALFAKQIKQFQKNINQQVSSQIISNRKNIEAQTKENIQKVKKQVQQLIQENLVKMRENYNKARQMSEQNKKNILSNTEKVKTQLKQQIITAKNGTLSNLYEIQSHFQTPTKNITDNKDVSSINLANKMYKNSKITIADQGYYKEVGDNFKIVGGCGLSMKNLIVKEMNLGQQKYQTCQKQFSTIDYETVKNILIEDKYYTCFKVRSKDQYNYKYTQEMFSPNLALFSDKESFEKRMIQFDEAQFLKKTLSQEKIRQKDLKSFGVDLEKQNIMGLKVSHIMSIICRNPQNIVLIQNHLNSKDRNGSLPIHYAAANSNYEVVKAIVRMDRNQLQKKNQRHLTPLHMAIYSHDYKMVDLLCSLGANVNQMLPNNMSPLIISTAINLNQISKTLLKYGSLVQIAICTGDTAIQYAIRNRDIEVATMIAKKINNVQKIKRKSTGMNPLHQAAEYGCLSVLEELLKTNKVHPNSKTDTGQTALHLAANNNHIECVKILVEKYRCDVNLQDIEMETALMMAIKSYSFESALYLADRQTINLCNKNQTNCSILAASYYMFDVAEVLRKRGQNFKKTDNFGESVENIYKKNGFLSLYSQIKGNCQLNNPKITAIDIKELEFSFKNRDIKQMQQKIQENIDKAIQNDQVGILNVWLSYKQPIHQVQEKLQLSCENGSIKCIQSFVKKYKDQISALINQKMVLLGLGKSGNLACYESLCQYLNDPNISLDKQNNTLGHLICLYGHINSFKPLLKYGVKFNLVNSKKIRPIEICIQNDDKQFLELLIAHYPEEKIPSFFHKNQCSKLLQQTQIAKIPLDKLNFAKKNQIGNKQKTTLLEAIKANDISIIQKFIKIGYNIGDKIQNTLPISLTIENNQIQTFCYILNTLSRDKANLKSLTEESFITSLLKYYRIEMLTQLLNVLDSKDKEMIKTNIFMKSQYNQNPYLQELFIKGTNKKFLQDMEIIINAIQALNGKILSQKVKNFPINELLFNTQLPLNQQRKRPLLFFIYENNFSTALPFISEKINPLIKDSEGMGLAVLFIGQSQNSKQHLGLTKQYFANQLTTILSITFKGKSFVEIAHALGKQELVEQFFKLSPKVKLSSVDKNGNTLLHLAIKINNYKNAKKLVQEEFRGDIDILNSMRRTPLSFACELNLTHMIELLISHNANPNIKDVEGNNCLHYLMKGGKSNKKSDCVKFLLNHILRIDEMNRDHKNALMMAQYIEDPIVTQILISKGANISLRDTNGYQALHYAAILNKYQNVKVLVSAGSNVNSKAERQDLDDEQKKKNFFSLNTPSHFAASRGNQKICSYLYHNGANFELKNVVGETVFENAIKGNKPIMLKLMNEIPQFISGKYSSQLLTACCKEDNYEALQFFAELKSFNLNSIDQNGRNLFHLCAIFGSTKCMVILLRHNVPLNYRDNDGNLPVHHSCLKTSITTLRFLVPYSEINEQNIEGNTPLHIACLQNNETLVFHLLMQRVSYNIQNKNGLTPGQIALMSGNKNIIMLFFVLDDENIFETKRLQLFFKSKIQEKVCILDQIRQIYEKVDKDMIMTVIMMRNMFALKLILNFSKNSLGKSKNLEILIAKAKLIFPESIPIIYFHLQSIIQIDQESTSDDYKKKQSYSDNFISEFQQQVWQQIYPNPALYQMDCSRLIKEFSTQGNFKLFKHDEIDKISQRLKFKELTHGQIVLFYQGVNNTVQNERKQLTQRLFNFIDFLINQVKNQDEEFFSKVKQVFLTTYPYNLLSTTVINLIKEIYVLKSQKLRAWFFRYFEPLAISDIKTELDKGIKVWTKFMNLIKRQLKNLEAICDPPQLGMSFCLQNSRYLENCLAVLQNPPQGFPNKNIQNKYIYLNQMVESTKTKRFTLIQQKHKNRSYSKSLSQIESQIIAYYPNDLRFLVEFQQALCESLMDESEESKLGLDDEDKTILCSKILEIIKGNGHKSFNKISLFIEMASRLNKYQGRFHFLLLFTVIKSQNCSFETFIRVCELLIDLQNPIEALKLLQDSKNNLSEIQSTLADIYTKQLETKFPQKSHQNLKNDFTTVSQFIKYPLTEKQFNDCFEMYQVVQKLGATIAKKSNLQLKNKARELALGIKQSLMNFDENKLKQFKCELLAILREQIRRCHKIFPYNTQIFALLMLLNEQQIENSKYKGCIAQIRTGEGKSTIVTMLAAYHGLRGQFVDIITSSPYLAVRDEIKYRQFFTTLGLTSSCISVKQGNPQKKKFDGMILFGTNYDFEFSIMREQIYNHQHRKTKRYGSQIMEDRKCQTVIVDEVDSLFVDMAFNSARLATNTPFHLNWVYEIIFKYVKECQQNQTKTDWQILKSKLRGYNNFQYSDYVESFETEKIQGWIQKAKRAMNDLHQNMDYSIRVNERTGEKEIIIVDCQNTGRLMLGSRWSNGLHQFVEVKEGLKPKDQSLTIASLSHPAFFGEYKKILGVTGTMGTQQERKQIKDVYNVNIKDVPPHFPNQRIRKSMSYVKQPEFYKKMIQQIKEVQKEKRPILIIFKSIKQSVQFSNMLQSHKLKHFTLNQIQKQHENYIISKAGHTNALTIATNTAGRGTDIILTPESKKNGGLHVIIAFYPVNSRVEDQGLGRAGRQGQKGTCKVCTHDKDPQVLKLISTSMILSMMFDTSNQIQAKLQGLREDKIEKLSAQRRGCYQSETLKYVILTRFCDKLQKFRQLIRENEVSFIFQVNNQLEKLGQMGLQNEKAQQIKENLSALQLKEVKQMKYNPLIKNFSKTLAQHISNMIVSFGSGNRKEYSSGQSLLKYNQGVLKSFLMLQIEYLTQQWAIFYSNEVTNYQKLTEAKMEEKWNQFYSQRLQNLEKNPRKELGSKLGMIYLSIF